MAFMSARMPRLSGIRERNGAMRLRALSGILVVFRSGDYSIKAQSAFAFTKVAFVDVEKGSLLLDQTVVIEVRDSSRLPMPRAFACL